MRSGVRRVVPLTFGWEHLPKSVSVHGASKDIRLREPVPGVLLEVDGGWFLLDTGFNTPTLLAEQLRVRVAPREIDDELAGDGGDAIERAFEHVGIDPVDVVEIALSHLHDDHAGGVDWFGRQAPIHCQRRELEHARSEPPPPGQALCGVDFSSDHIDWRLDDGDVQLAPGLTAIATYGHTVGHQSFVVDLVGGGGFVFAFDAADLQENLDDEVAPGGVAPGAHDEAVASIRRLKRVAAERGYPVIPGHDPEAWPRITRALGIDRPVGPGRFLGSVDGTAADTTP